VVENFTLSVHHGEVVALLGHNASGKRTIVKMAYGLTKPFLGEIFLAGFNVVTQKAGLSKFRHFLVMQIFDLRVHGVRSPDILLSVEGSQKNRGQSGGDIIYTLFKN